MGDHQYPTDPYGYMEYVVGRVSPSHLGGEESDMVCLDFAKLENGMIRLHAVVNCDSESYTENYEVTDVPPKEAPAEARRLCKEAMTWCGEGKLDLVGWNQDPYYFYRRVKAYVSGGALVERFQPCSCEKKNEVWCANCASE